MKQEKTKKTFKWIGLFLSICLTISIFQTETLTREIRLFPPTWEFEIEGSTQFFIELPITSIRIFQTSNGVTTISGRTFSLVAEEHKIQFEFEENLLIANLVVPQDSAFVMGANAVKITNESGRPIDQIEFGDTIVIHQDYLSIRSFTMNGIRMYGHFEALAIDNSSGATTNLLDLDSNSTLNGKLIFRPLILGN